MHFTSFQSTATSCQHVHHLYRFQKLCGLTILLLNLTRVPVFFFLYFKYCSGLPLHPSLDYAYWRLTFFFSKLSNPDKGFLSCFEINHDLTPEIGHVLSLMIKHCDHRTNLCSILSQPVTFPIASTALKTDFLSQKLALLPLICQTNVLSCPSLRKKFCSRRFKVVSLRQKYHFLPFVICQTCWCALAIV